jgi:hypothetical protein
MAPEPDQYPLPDLVDPDRLTLVLERAGWQLVGGRRGMYNRLAPPDDIDASGYSRRSSLIVPLDKRAPDYNDMMRAALISAQSIGPRGVWISEVLPRLSVEPSDSFRFRKESSAPAGLISWKQGEELIQSARAVLVAGAKSHIEGSRRYSNRHGQFASRYLDSILMGQTAIGSYIVTAYAPTRAQVALSGSSPEEQSLPGIDAVTTRSVTFSVSNALEATAEAIEHYRFAGTLSGFEENVRNGVSYDLVTALKLVAQDSDGGDITIDWEPSDTPARGDTFSFEFRGSDAAILESAASLLGVTIEDPEPIVVAGRVHLLTKSRAGGPGVFGIETVESPSRKYRVRLANPEDYHVAVRAHDEDQLLRVRGNYERDGISWLYNAEILGAFGPVIEPGQLGLLDPESGIT